MTAKFYFISTLLLVTTWAGEIKADDDDDSNAFFRAHPSGWACGSMPEMEVRVGFSFDVDRNLSSVVSGIIRNCEMNCQLISWCRAYSLVELPTSIPDSPVTKPTPTTTPPEYAYAEEYADMPSAGCLIFTHPYCQVLRWPGPEISATVYKIPAIDGFRLFQKRCMQSFDSYIMGPPEACGKACSDSPYCFGFNYNFVDDSCFLMNVNRSVITQTLKVRRALPVQSLRNSFSDNTQDASSGLPSSTPISYSCQTFRLDTYHVFYAKQDLALPNSYVNDVVQQYPGFYAHNGNCRGGVSSNFEAVTAAAAAQEPQPLAIAINSCPKCNTTLDGCLTMCKNLPMCKGVSALSDGYDDYTRPFCFLKSTTCPPDRIEPNAVYRFYEKLVTSQ